MSAMTKLSFPFTEDKICALKVGDEVLTSAVVFTGRDAVHKYLHEGGPLPPGVSLRDGILYHCGPVVLKDASGGWKVTAAGAGAAQVLAECIRQVRNVYFLEKFGSPEAIWELEVENFPAVVTMDAHGNSLH